MIYTSEDESIQYTAKDIFNLSQGLGYKVQQPPSTGRSILISIWPAGARLSLSFSFPPPKDVPPNQISFSRWGGETEPAEHEGRLSRGPGAARGDSRKD